MADELNGAVDTVVDDGSQSQGGSDGSELQQQMTGDFFYDDGSDAVVDSLGNPQMDTEGNVIRSMDAFHKTAKPSQQQPDKTKPGTGTKDGTQGSSKLAAGFDSVFQKNGKFDFDGVVKTSSAAKDYSYKMQSVFKQPEPGQTGNKPPVDPKEHIRTSIDGLRTQLTTERLEPIKTMYEGIYQVCSRYGQALPAGLLDDIHEAVNSVYLAKSGEVTEAIDKKRDELIGEAVAAQSQQAEMKAAEQMSAANFKKIADAMIPKTVPQDQREDKLSELIFGHKGGDGKFVRGYGADVIEALFDASMGGKTFGSPDEWKQAYNQFWSKFSSNPENVQLVANISFARYVAANHSKYRDEYRKAWEAEFAQKGKNKNVQSRSGGALSEDDSANSLMDYHRTPQRNIR